MTELAVRQDTAVQPVAAPGFDLMAWADSARRASQVAVSLSRTPFVPQSLRGNSDEITVGNITAAILTGVEVGMQPMAALRALDVIQGTPAFRAITLRALVLSHGHDMWLVEANSTRAIVAGRRAGSSEVQKSTWTIDRAKALGLTGKQNWRNQPQAMLTARATAECARLVAADVIMGVPYAVEELEDGDVDTITPATQSSPPQRRTARRKTQPAPATARPTVETVQDETPDPFEDEPVPAIESSGLDEFAPETTSNPEPEKGLTAKQRGAINAMFDKDFGLSNKDREYRLTAVAVIIGRQVESSNEVTVSEASTLIDRLKELAEQPDPRAALDDLIADALESETAEPEQAALDD